MPLAMSAHAPGVRPLVDRPLLDRSLVNRSWVTWPMVAAALVAVGAAVGTLSARSHLIGVFAGVAVLLLGMTAVDLGAIVLLVLPAALLMERAGGFLSAADVVLAMGSIVALILVRREEFRRMQALTWAGMTYLASLIPTLVLNRYSANVIEWAHEVMLVLGSMVVGWVLGRRDRARTALNLFMFVCAIMAIAAVIGGVLQLAKHGHFGPVFLPYMNKNFIGDTLATAIVIAYARPVWQRWSRRRSHLLMVTFAAGIAASDARQAMISAGVGLVVVNLRGRTETIKRSRLIWFAVIPVGVFVINTVVHQLTSHTVGNSSSQRLDWFAQSIQIWHLSPVFGVGLRWWYTGRYAGFQPPNAEFEMLTSAGLVGTAGFLIMFAVAVWVLLRMDRVYGTVALAAVVVRFTQGQLDLYWVAAQASTLWIIAGIAYGQQFHDQAVARRQAPAANPGPPIHTGHGSLQMAAVR